VAVDVIGEGEDKEPAPVPVLEAAMPVSLGALAGDEVSVQGRRPHFIYSWLGSLLEARVRMI
jgi:hypothetical protein